MSYFYGIYFVFDNYDSSYCNRMSIARIFFLRKHINDYNEKSRDALCKSFEVLFLYKNFINNATSFHLTLNLFFIQTDDFFLMLPIKGRNVVKY
jgi:hypothetical protein